MANTNVGIAQSWSLIAFCAGSKLQLGDFENSETHEKFKSLIVTSKADGSRKFIHFSSNLGELTPSQISAMKDGLQVVQLNGSDSYILCKQGEGNWEDIVL